MGGNFICVKGEDAFMGNSLNITRAGAISRLIRDISEMAQMLNSAHEAKFEYPLWPLLDSQLSSGLIFAGSTRHIFEESEAELAKNMPEVSDLDLYIPRAGRRGDTLSQLFEDLANSGESLGSFTVICYKKHDLKEKPSVPGETLAVDRGTNAIFKYVTELGDDAYIQIDFMPTSLPIGEEDPDQMKKMELWVQLSHSSDWDDRKEGVKGVFHKYLIQSMFTALTRRPGKILTAGSLKTTVKPRKRLGYDISVRPPKVSAETEREMRMSSFSVEKAVARKRLTAIEEVIDSIISGIPGEVPDDVKAAARKEIYDAIARNPDLIGQDLYKKTVDVSSNSDEDPREFETDVYEIFNMLFGFIPDDENVKKLYSFRGLLSLIGDHILSMPGGEQKCKEIFKDFVGRLFGPIAQEIDTQDQLNDAKKKNASIERIRQVPELESLLPSEEEIDAMRKEYYSDFDIRMGTRQQTAQRKKASLEETPLRLFVRGILNA
jgi:hypothetical protein